MRYRTFLGSLQLLFAVTLFIGPFVCFWALADWIQSANEPGRILAPDIPTFASVVALVAFLASVLSLVGIISTTILAWRKDRRDVDLFQIELQKSELEIAKLRRELNEVYLQGPKRQAQTQDSEQREKLLQNAAVEKGRSRRRRVPANPSAAQDS